MQFDLQSRRVHLSLLIHQGEFINYLMNLNFGASYDILLEQGRDFEFWVDYDICLI